MLNQHSFEQRYEPDWQRLQDILLSMQSAKPGSRPSKAQYAEFPDLYLRVSNHLALARTRGYSQQLVHRLNQLVYESYNALYRVKGRGSGRVMAFVTRQFPQLVRRHALLFWISTALFYIPALFTGLACYLDDSFIYRLGNVEQVHMFEFMYEPEANFRSQDRESASDFEMFGHYIQNNISISFREFAGGILLGIGTLFFLIYNGLIIGGIAGHLSSAGYIDTFWGFVAGHAAFELTAICISGMSGLLLATALINPGNLSRATALKQRALIAVPLLLGAALKQLPTAIKYWVAAGFWLAPGCSLLLGRKPASPRYGSDLIGVADEPR